MEKKIYVINCNEDFDFREAEKRGDFEGIITKAEEIGSVYSLKGFQNACNNEELSLENSFIYIK